MRKSPLPKAQAMTEAAYVAQAAIWSKALTRMKARGPGDTENVMRQIEREYGIDYGTQWSLRYRVERFKAIGVNAYETIKAAYQAELHRQMRKLQHEIETTKAVSGSSDDYVASAEAFVREMDTSGK